MSFENIFTDYLYTKKLNINLKDLKNHILQTKKTQPGNKISNVGGWQSQNFHLVHTKTEPLFDALDNEVKKIKKKLNYSSDLKLLSYWYNINSRNSYNTPHRHVGPKSNQVVSGVFYVQTFPDCGKIVFRRNDPLHDLLYAKQIEKYNSYNSSIWRKIPEDNLCVLFPPSLEHFVEPNLIDKNRISMSFNYGI